jgi:hypothetical protein
VIYVRDEATRMVEEAYVKAVGRMTYYVGRGYWRAAERWAQAVWSLAESLDEVGWQDSDERRGAADA